jgi:hypothetical protein
MSQNPLILLAWSSDMLWIISAVGLVVACMAFTLGRRVAPKQPKPVVKAVRGREDPMDVFVLGSNSERREAPRRKGNTVEVLLSRGPDLPQIHGWVVNRSVKGLGLVLDEPLGEGTVLDVRPRTAPVSLPWIPVKVQRCRPQGQEWDVGCAFVRAPQYNVLLLFG